MTPGDQPEMHGPHLLLYRLVESSPPTLYDFTSQEVRGRPLRFRSARALRLWSGLSVYRRWLDAASLGSRSPALGAFIAELRGPLNGSIRFELDNGANGHCTIWGPPEVLLDFVVSVAPIDGVH